MVYSAPIVATDEAGYGNQPDDVVTIRIDSGAGRSAPCVLVHVLEAAGIATVVVSSVREVTVKVASDQAVR